MPCHAREWQGERHRAACAVNAAATQPQLFVCIMCPLPPSPAPPPGQAPLLPYMLKQLGGDASYYGMLQSSFSALQLMGGLLSGRGAWGGGGGC